MADANPTYFEIRASGNFVKVNVLRLSHPSASLDYDKNWLDSEISVKVGGFVGGFKANLMTIDFEIFKRELKYLYNNLKSSATFEGIERQVRIHINGDGIGNLNAKCCLTDFAGTGNELKCEIDFDQTQIPKLINQLEQITMKFPITGDLRIPD